MGLYENWVLPRLLNMAMRNHVLDSYRRRAINLASGLVLEIGVGSGPNLPLYGAAVDRVVGLDVSPELLARDSVKGVVDVDECVKLAAELYCRLTVMNWEHRENGIRGRSRHQTRPGTHERDQKIESSLAVSDR